MYRMLLKMLVLLTITGSAASALAGEQPYDQTKFEQAQAQHQSIVVWFHANWCPTCRAQQPIVERLSQSPEMKNVTVFVADFDKEKALERSLRVVQQSTFVVFRKGREVTRSTGETNQQAIRSTWEKAL
ncbi:MAG: thioredoxin [Paraburkholderia sp.]|nr:MAG: thioredoxin [Paraburkholderia sp.]